MACIVCVCVCASVARISFYLLRHSIMLRWSYIIHLPLVWRQHTHTNTNRNKSPYWIIILDFTLFALFFPLSLSLVLLLLFPSIRRMNKYAKIASANAYSMAHRIYISTTIATATIFRISDIWLLSMRTEGDDLVKPYPANRISNSTQLGSCWNLIFGWTRYHQIIFWMKNAIRIWIIRHSLCRRT